MGPGAAGSGQGRSIPGAAARAERDGAADARGRARGARRGDDPGPVARLGQAAGRRPRGGPRQGLVGHGHGLGVGRPLHGEGDVLGEPVALGGLGLAEEVLARGKRLDEVGLAAGVCFVKQK